MNITILGAGAIGSLWTCYLNQAGHKVSVLTKDPDQNEFTIQLNDQPKITVTANNFESLKDCDLLLITVKAWQVQEAVLPLFKHIHPDTILMFMHNGMGAVDEIREVISGYPVVLATTTQAAYKPHRNQVLHTGFGTTQLGGYNQAGNQCEFLAGVLNHALPETVWNQNLPDALWSKLAVNCAINPLTAIYQIKNGALTAPEYQQQLQRIVKEVVTVMNSANINADFDTLMELVNKVICTTAENNSSMQQDIFHRRRSEIDYINGYLCHVAEEKGIKVPENQKLYQQIKQIEQGWTNND